MQVILQSSRHPDSQTANKEQLNSKEPALSQGHWYVLLFPENSHNKPGRQDWRDQLLLFLFFIFAEDKSQDTDVRKIIKVKELVTQAGPELMFPGLSSMPVPGIPLLHILQRTWPHWVQFSWQFCFPNRSQCPTPELVHQAQNLVHKLYQGLEAIKGLDRAPFLRRISVRS